MATLSLLTATWHVPRRVPVALSAAKSSARPLRWQFQLRKQSAFSIRSVFVWSVTLTGSDVHPPNTAILAHHYIYSMSIIPEGLKLATDRICHRMLARCQLTFFVSPTHVRPEVFRSMVICVFVRVLVIMNFFLHNDL